MALRDMGLLQETRILSGNGLGNLIGGFLAGARWGEDEPSWAELMSPLCTDSTDQLQKRFLSPLFEWCLTNQEYDMFWGRIKRREWFSWGSSHWASDLSREWPTEVKKGMEAMRRIYSVDDDPIFLFNAFDEVAVKPICITNDVNCPRSNDLNVSIRCARTIGDMSHLLAASVLHPREHDALSMTSASGVVHGIRNGLIADAFGLETSRLYFIKEKLGQVASKHHSEQKDSRDSSTHQILLLDGFTNCPSFHQLASHGTRVAATAQSDALCGADDCRQEVAMCYRKSVARMYDPTRMNGDPADLSVNRVAFFEMLGTQDPVLTAANASSLRECTDLGYWETVHQYGDRDFLRQLTLVPVQAVDRFAFREQLLPRLEWQKQWRNQDLATKLPDDGYDMNRRMGPPGYLLGLDEPEFSRDDRDDLDLDWSDQDLND